MKAVDVEAVSWSRASNEVVCCWSSAVVPFCYEEMNNGCKAF